MNQPFTLKRFKTLMVFIISLDNFPQDTNRFSVILTIFSGQMRLHSVVGCSAGHPLNNHPPCAATSMHQVLEGALMWTAFSE